MRVVAALGAGLLFGAGLSLSGMIDPAVVLAFLDVAAIAEGGWNPALVFVMVAAVLVTTVGYALIFRRRAPLLESGFALPRNRSIDCRLIAGAAIFGLGWGTSRLLSRARHCRLGSGAWQNLALRRCDARRHGPSPRSDRTPRHPTHVGVKPRMNQGSAAPERKVSPWQAGL